MGTRHPHDKRVSTPNKNFFQCFDKAVIGGIVNRHTGGAVNLKDSRSGNPAAGEKGSAEIPNQLVDQYEPNLFCRVRLQKDKARIRRHRYNREPVLSACIIRKQKPDVQPHIGNTVCKCLFIFGNLRGNNRVEVPVKIIFQKTALRFGTFFRLAIGKPMRF